MRQNEAVRLDASEAAPIADPNRIYLGQETAMPRSVVTDANAFDYHVSRGEALSSIAARVYGDQQMWQHVYREDVEPVADRDRILPGQVLMLTPVPTIR